MKNYFIILFWILSVGALIDSFYNPDNVSMFLWFKVNIWVERFILILGCLGSMFLYFGERKAFQRDENNSND
jgi:hypothetical protein